MEKKRINFNINKLLYKEFLINIENSKYLTMTQFFYEKVKEFNNSNKQIKKLDFQDFE